MSYGLPYQGSKSKIAPWVIDHLPDSDILVDLFAGGCAVTHAAIVSEKFRGGAIVNDISNAPQLFVDAINGKYSDINHLPSREEFYDTDLGKDALTRLVSSFGNNGKDYAYGRDVCDVKNLAENMLLAKTVDKRYSLFKDFIKVYDSEKKSPDKLQALENLSRLQALENLSRLQRLQRLVSVSQRSYNEVKIPDNSTIYADPPYRGTNTSLYGDFDFDKFYEWVSNCGHMIIISEYTAPTHCVEVASIKTTSSMSANGKGQDVTERLFVQEEYEEEYRRAMGQLF